MSRNVFAAGIIAGALALAACSHQGSDGAASSAEKITEAESRVSRGTNGEVMITLDGATQKLMGLQTTSLVATQMSAQVKGFGRVLDPAPLMELMTELGKAELEFDNSHADLERMKVLKQQNNASEKAFQAAEFAYRQNQAAVAAVWVKIKNAWGERLVEMTGPIVVPVGTTRKWDPVLERILDAGSSLVRVDLDAGEPSESLPWSARLIPVGERATPIEAMFFDNARTVDPQTQGRGLFFLVATNGSKLAPGIAVTAFVNTAAAPVPGVVLPRSAILRVNGTTCVYVQESDDKFERVEVSLDHPLEAGWFVAKGLKAEAKIVTVGAQQLLSEELIGHEDGAEHH